MINGSEKRSGFLFRRTILILALPRVWDHDVGLSSTLIYDIIDCLRPPGLPHTRLVSAYNVPNWKPPTLYCHLMKIVV